MKVDLGASELIALLKRALAVGKPSAYWKCSDLLRNDEDLGHILEEAKAARC